MKLYHKKLFLFSAL